MKSLLKQYPKMQGESLSQYRARLHRIAGQWYTFCGLRVPSDVYRKVDRALQTLTETH